MSPQIKKSVEEDCLAYVGTDKMAGFMENIGLICEGKKSQIRPIDLPTGEYSLIYVFTTCREHLVPMLYKSCRSETDTRKYNSVVAIFQQRFRSLMNVPLTMTVIQFM